MYREDLNTHRFFQERGKSVILLGIAFLFLSSCTFQTDNRHAAQGMLSPSADYVSVPSISPPTYTPKRSIPNHLPALPLVTLTSGSTSVPTSNWGGTCEAKLTTPEQEPTPVPTFYFDATLTPARIVAYQPDRWKKYEVEGMTAGRVRAIDMDFSGKLWVAVADGISLFSFDGKEWVNHKLAGLDEYDAGMIAVDSDGCVWVGGSARTDDIYSTRIFRFDGSSWEVIDGGGQSISSIVVDPGNGVWFGSYNDNFDDLPEPLIRLQDGERFAYPKEDVGSNAIYDMVIESNGILWLYTEEGLVQFDGQTWKMLPSGKFWHTQNHERWLGKNLALAPDGALWFTSAGLGITRLKDDTWSNYQYPEIAGASVPRDLVVTRDGQIWISYWDQQGGGGGIARFDGKTWEIYKGMPFIMAYGLFESPDGALWIGTERGLYRYMPLKN